jgi:CPA1 family monovalent cation:H+ antiporter
MLDAPGEGADDAAEQERLAGELREAAASALTAADLRRRDGSPFEPELIERMALRYAAPATQETTAFEQDMLELRLALNVAMRGRLTKLSSGGAFSTRTLRRTLAELDADQLSLELRLSGNE